MKRVLFLGEDSTIGAGRYLGAVLRWSKFPFDYLPDQTPVPSAWLKRRYAAVILSDYRARSWTPNARAWLTERVHAGMGLFMIGGWASFTGLVGRYHGSSVETLLPVECLKTDDRVNRTAVLLAGKDSPIVCGYHRVRVKPGSKTILDFQDFHAGRRRVTLGPKRPALVLGRAGLGRTAAFMSDCAPHWAGGLMDWGHPRVTVHLPQARSVEVGESYLAFFRKWIAWVSRAT